MTYHTKLERRSSIPFGGREKVLVTGLTAEEVNCMKNCARALVNRPDLDVTVMVLDNSPACNLLPEFNTIFVSDAPREELADMVEDYCVNNGIRILFPGMENDVYLFSSHKERLAERGITVISSDHTTVMEVADKSNLTRILDRLGLPTIKGVVIESMADAHKIDTLRFPIILKPTFSFGALGLEVIEEGPVPEETLKSVLDRGTVIAQEYIPGKAGSIHLTCYMFDADGTPRYVYQSKSLKTAFEFGGPSISGTPISEPKLLEYSNRLLSVMGPCFGPICIEAKRHEETGEFYIMDVNMRIWGYSSLAQDAGLPFPYAAVLSAQGRPIRSRNDYLRNIKMVRKEDGDHSYFTFDNGKTVEVPRHRQMQSVAICPDHADADMIKWLCDDDSNGAVVVMTDGTTPVEVDHPKLFTWALPDYLHKQDQAYWVGHIFGAEEVRTYENGFWISRNFDDLSQERWLDFPLAVAA